MNLLSRYAGRRLRTERTASLKNVRLWGSTTGFHMLGHMLGLGSGYLLYTSGTMTVGTVFMVIWYTEILFRPLEQLTRRWKIFSALAPASAASMSYGRHEAGSRSSLLRRAWRQPSLLRALCGSPSTT